MDVFGGSESFALLQVWGTPPTGFANLGIHAIAFTGRTTGFLDVHGLKDAQDDKDAPISYDVDITVGPEWRDVTQVAPLVVVGDVYSSNTDADDEFQIAVQPRTPSWSVTTAPPKKIVLHVKVTQAGEWLNINALSYSVTATGNLRHPEAFVP